jgi:hypothetical protein
MSGWRKRQVLDMAEKASSSKQDWWKNDDALEAFAALVRADEREECAMTAENTSVYDRYSPEDTIADAIRKRGQA